MEPSSKERHLQKCLCQAKRVKEDDPFSRLPDELIVSHILSRFSLEEGARYNILSRRWKKLWADTIGSKLIFAPEHLRYTNINDSLGQTRFWLGSRKSVDDRIDRFKASFECWISNVVQAYAMPRVDELTVQFPFDFSNRESIDMWVDCAFKKGVSRLELALHYWGKKIPDEIYCFPEIDKFRGMLANCDGFYNLREVVLSGVDVSSQVIEFMLAHFPLERLCISDTYIDTLSVSGDGLKILKLDECDSLKISASNLMSLTYAGSENSVFFEHVPNLSDLSVGEKFCATFLPTGFLNGGYTYISRLKRLEFVMSRKVLRESVNYPLELPVTPNLEELKIEIYGVQDACCLWPLLLIKAAPILCKFSVKLHYHFSKEIPSQIYNAAAQRMREAAKTVRHHQYLKTIELVDYFGEAEEWELVQHLFGVSEVLEQVIVSPIYLDRLCISVINGRAQAVATLLPPNSKAKLIIL
ncbi:uncharacterized protein LOC141610625 [Silene latifolia]|uniref:uncharacterized protein LOC141610625 n=1 Tax=Silene latifolia TaxID=37657 RepID=UPI003D7838DB